MKTLYQAIEAHGGKNAPYVLNHLGACGILDWQDCTKVNLTEFCDHLKNEVCQNSAKNYTAILKAVLNRYKEAGVVPCADIKEALKCKGESSQKVYLNTEELAMLEKLTPMTMNELFVKLCFLISAKTGMRVSDTLRVGEDNIRDGVLTYVSQKTKVEASVPVSAKTEGWIAQVNKMEARPNIGTYELIIKRLCQRAGIDSRCRLFKAGKERSIPKWEAVSSHTARVSFVTNALELGVPLISVSRMAGHTNTAQTERYNASRKVSIPKEAMAYFTK